MRISALQGFSPKIVQEAVTKSAALSLAAASIGIAIVPESIQKRAPEQIVFKENMPNTGRDNFLQTLEEQIGR